MQRESRAGGRLEVEVSEGVMTVTVCRPEVRNALDIETMVAFGELMEELDKRPDVTVVVVAGEGSKAFVSGGDLSQLAGLKGEVGGEALSRTMGSALSRMGELEQVTLAAIGGDAWGGGVELALACDLRLMERSSGLGLTQGRFGVTTGWGGSRRLVGLVGYSRALELLLGLRRIGAEEALALGLINEVVEDGQALVRSQRLASEIISLGRDVVLGIKEVVQAGLMMKPHDALLKEREVFSRLWAGERHLEAVRAWKEHKARV